MQAHDFHRLLSLKEVMARTGMSRSYLYREISLARFVAPAKCGRASRWDAAAVEAWICARLATAKSVEGA